MNEEGPVSLGPHVHWEGHEVLAEPKQGTPRASRHNLAWDKRTLTLQGLLGTSHTPTPSVKRTTQL